MHEILCCKLLLLILILAPLLNSFTLCEENRKYFNEEDIVKSQEEYSKWRLTINDTSVVYRYFQTNVKDEVDVHMAKKHPDHKERPFVLGPIGPRCNSLDSFGVGDLEKRVRTPAVCCYSFTICFAMLCNAMLFYAII
jgi:hypothetical protein